MCGICGEMRFDKLKISENNKQNYLILSNFVVQTIQIHSIIL